jgi:rSAM/selenodomain-associated transferase 1
VSDHGLYTLIIFTKAPRPYQVKTRLVPPLSPDQACQLARAFLDDLLTTSRGLRGIRRVLAATEPDDAWLRDMASREGIPMIAQTGEDLGRRMEAAIHSELKRGRRGICVIGADSPTLPLSVISEAFQKLERVDVVLGPATDGGYYLIGANREIPELWPNMPWGTPSVLPLTLRRLAQSPRSFALLPFWYDVDDINGLRLLHGHLECLSREGRALVAPATRELVQRWALPGGPLDERPPPRDSSPGSNDG